MTPSASPSPALPLWRKWLWRLLRSLLVLLLLVGLFLVWFISVPPAGQRAGREHPYFRCPCPHVLAHQGASGHAPSNTLVAFQRAREMGADILELDVHMSADGVVVVSHDATLDRHTNAQGALKERTWRALQKVDAGYRFSRDGKTFPFRGKGVTIPSLEQVFKAFPTQRINIEIKQHKPPMVGALWSLLKKHKATQRVMVVSFRFDTLQAFRKVSKGAVPTGASAVQGVRLMLAWWLGVEGWLWRANIDAVQLPHLPAIGESKSEPTTNRPFVDMIHRHHMVHHAWTVNDPKQMKVLLQRGVDGLITDYPDRAREVMQALGLRKALHPVRALPRPPAPRRR